MLTTEVTIVILGVLGTISTAIVKLVPRRNSNNVSEKACEERHVSLEKLRSEQFNNINEKLSDTSTRLKTVEENTFKILTIVKSK